MAGPDGRPRRGPPLPSRGAFLIEALISLVVISMTVAAIFGLLANGLRASNNALSRAEATDIAVSTLARMTAEDLVTLAGRYDPHGAGAGFRVVLAAARRLPGVTETTNVPVVSVAPGPSANSRHVSVTIFWQLPNEPLPHRASLKSAVGSW